MRDLNIDVLSAHIEVVGAQAVDVFYVRNHNGDGQISETERKALRAKLLDVLEIKIPKKAA